MRALISRGLQAFGIDVKRFVGAGRGTFSYLRDFMTLKKQLGPHPDFPFGLFYPCFEEATAASGVAVGAYFHQDLLVARRIFESKPERHIDVGSRIDGFVAHVAAFREIHVADIRPQLQEVHNIRFIQTDLMAPLTEDLEGSCDSLSCLHALEHFGLGRYGDSIDCNGHLLGLANLQKMLKTGGRLYLSVPIGPQRIEFNAHRVFSLRGLLEQFRGAFSIHAFSWVDDKGALHENIELTKELIDGNCGCRFGCGIFELTKA